MEVSLSVFLVIWTIFPEDLKRGEKRGRISSGGDKAGALRFPG
jgi:hypothetical protein